MRNSLGKKQKRQTTLIHVFKKYLLSTFYVPTLGTHYWTDIKYLPTWNVCSSRVQRRRQFTKNKQTNRSYSSLEGNKCYGKEKVEHLQEEYRHSLQLQIRRPYKVIFQWGLRRGEGIGPWIILGRKYYRQGKNPAQRPQCAQDEQGGKDGWNGEQERQAAEGMWRRRQLVVTRLWRALRIIMRNLTFILSEMEGRWKVSSVIWFRLYKDHSDNKLKGSQGRRETTAIIQTRGAGDLDKEASSRGRKTGWTGFVWKTGFWMHSEDKAAGFAHSLDVEWERKSRARMSPRFLAWITRKQWRCHPPKWGRLQGGQACREDQKSSFTPV